MFDLLSLPIFMNTLLHAVLTLPPVLWKPQKGVLKQISTENKLKTDTKHNTNQTSTKILRRITTII